MRDHDVRRRDRDIRRVAALVYRHRTKPQAEPFRGDGERWSVIRFVDWALSVLIDEGYISPDPKDGFIMTNEERIDRLEQTMRLAIIRFGLADPGTKEKLWDALDPEGKMRASIKRAQENAPRP